jgi:hypothetical protein
VKDSIDYFIKVNKPDVAFVCSVLEAYEGMVAVRTINPDTPSPTSTLRAMVSPDFIGEFETVCKNLSRVIELNI